MKIELTYGKDKITLDVENQFLAGPLIKARVSQAIPGTPCEIIRQSFRTPKNRPSLRETVKNQRVGMVVSDELRVGLQEQIVSCLLAEIAAGQPEEIFVFVATGSHHPEIYAKNIITWINRYATELKLKYQVFPNFCEQKEDYIYLGETTYQTPVYVHKMWMACPVRVHGHEAKYHYMNGYSCIDKHVVPGLSAHASIQANHKLALHHHDSVAGKNAWHQDQYRQNNPFSQDGKQCRKMSEKYIYDQATGTVKEAGIITFGLDMVSQKDKIFWIDCGDPDLVCQDVTVAVDKFLGFEVEKTKYLVQSPGGPPASETLYYVQNGFDMVIKGALLPGGEALVVAPCNGRPEVPEKIRGICPDPESMELFWYTLVKYLDKPLEDWISFVDKNFKLFMWKTDRVIKLFKDSKIKIYLYSQLPDEVVRKGGFIPEHDPQRWIEERAARHDGKIRCVDEANKLCVLGK
jgi:nickel-dependent lactate racemase